MRRDVHSSWQTGVFALKPHPAHEILEEESQPFQLRVEFHWLPYLKEKTQMELGKYPLDCCTVPDVGKPPYQWLIIDGETGQKIETGHVITFTTPDPEVKPLPSRGLLQMQFVLHQVAAMSAAGELDDVDEDDESKDTGEDIPIEHIHSTL